MTTKTKLLFGTLLVVPLLAFGSVAAHEGDDTTTQTDTSTNEVKTGNEGLTLQERLDKYKAAVQKRLDNAEKARLKLRCKASQGHVSSLEGRIKGLETSRQHVYENTTSRLTSLSDKLKAKGVDTTEYDTQIAELKTKIETFNTDLAKYHEAVSDLSQMDCTADPDAFKAALETARTLRSQVVDDGQAIRDYLSNTIKPTLKAIRQQLEQKTEGEDQ